jgi:nucleotide-binding universal stress UspA family protein
MTTIKPAEHAHHGIVVGVTGQEESSAALRWAAEEARRTGQRVTLAHVVTPILPPPPPSVLITSGESQAELGRRTLAEVMLELQELCGDAFPCDSVLVEGHAASALVELSQDAELVVTGHRPRRGRGRIRVSSTAISVGAHAHCPAVTLPDAWEPAPPGDEPRWVTVGVHEAGAPDPVLEAAFQAASRRGRPLRLVHAFRYDTVYDDIIRRRVESDWEDRLVAEMMQAAEPFMKRHPDVKVDVLAVHQWPADALADLASSSDLLVVGRHGSPRGLPHRIGSIARTAIATAACPVMVVPPKA